MVKKPKHIEETRRPRFYMHMYTMLVHETDFVPLISDNNFLNLTPFSDSY